METGKVSNTYLVFLKKERNETMKGLKILVLGLGIWAVTLIWPEINQILTLQVMLAGVVGLGLILLGRRFMNHQQLVTVGEDAVPAKRASRPPHDSHPIKPIGLA